MNFTNKKISKITFIKVSDISCKYPFLEVYFNDDTLPFMDISIDETSDALQFNIYQGNIENITLEIDILSQLYQKALIFKEHEIKEAFIRGE